MTKLEKWVGAVAGVSLLAAIIAWSPWSPLAKKTAALPVDPLNLYVNSVIGNDDGPCSEAKPCKTIQGAIAKVPARVDRVVNISPSPGGYRVEGAPPGKTTITNGKSTVKLEDVVFDNSSITVNQ